MNVYLKAANLLDAGKTKFSCCAVAYASGPSGWPSEADDYSQLFAPRCFGNLPAWGREFGVTEKMQKECRVLALCFAAAMHETGDI